MSEEEHAATRRKKGILIDGDDVPPPIGSFIVSHINAKILGFLTSSQG